MCVCVHPQGLHRLSPLQLPLSFVLSNVIIIYEINSIVYLFQNKNTKYIKSYILLQKRRKNHPISHNRPFSVYMSIFLFYVTYF